MSHNLYRFSFAGLFFVGASAACGGSSTANLEAPGDSHDAAPSPSPYDAGTADGAQTADSSADATSGAAEGGADVSGGCASGSMLCQAACFDVQTDPNNCGRCGHGCLGSSCTAGMCDPIVLANGQLTITALAVDGANVYWSASPPQGGGTIAAQARSAKLNAYKAIASSSRPAIELEARPPALFFSDRYQLVSMPTAGGANTDLKIGPSVLFEVDAASSIAYIFSNVAIYECRVDATDRPCTPLESATDFTAIDSIAITPMYTFWPDSTRGVIRRYTRATGAIADFAKAQDVAQYTRYDGTYLYWAAMHGATGGIFRSPVDAANMTEVTPVGTDNVHGMVVDAKSVAYIDATKNTIMVAPSPGGASIAVASGGDPLAIAMDDEAVYWTDSDGAVRKVARP